KTADQYRALFRDGERALAAKQFDEAILAFRQAHMLMPGETLAFERAADAQKAKAVDGHLTKVRNALAAGKLKDAEDAYREAVKSDPNNPQVVQALADVRKAQIAAEEATKTAQQRDARFNDLVTKGREALAARKPDEAIRILNDAEKLKPGDATVR